MAHPGHGGCTIQSICEREFAGERKRYFVLIPKTDPNTTILAPVDNADKIGLREIISAEDADHLLDYYAQTEVSWVSDHAKRRQAYEATLKSGDLSSIARMIKELTVHASEAKLNHSDQELLPKAQRKLFSEIALAKGIGLEQVATLTAQVG